MTKRDLPHWHLPSMLFHFIIDYTTNHIETLPIGINSHGIVDSGHALTSAAAVPLLWRIRPARGTMNRKFQTCNDLVEAWLEHTSALSGLAAQVLCFVTWRASFSINKFSSFWCGKEPRCQFVTRVSRSLSAGRLYVYYHMVVRNLFILNKSVIFWIWNVNFKKLIPKPRANDVRLAIYWEMAIPAASKVVNRAKFELLMPFSFLIFIVNMKTDLQRWSTAGIPQRI